MSDIFGRVFSIFLAVIILFGMPFIYMNERAKSARQLFLLTESTAFIDSTCNTGVITDETLRRFYEKISRGGPVNIKLLHESKEYSPAGEVSVFYDEDDIYKAIDAGERYAFLKGDYLKVMVWVNESFSIFPQIKDNSVSVYYGGTIKQSYEDS
ncbi:MAG: hypothetical protein K6E56_03035 [Lachnospiraceae bacterium]|nr:hypothetical protein [Lachnospiraceae bacterium]